MRHLNIKEKLPLKGVSLVEASAGTGKTFSITKIILQALLSDDVKIEEILVVTFTEAATKELRSRIRDELHKFEKYMESPEKPNDEYDAIIANSEISDKKKRTTLIRAALLNIDQAAIYTIHSFCQRMLTENAFESKIAFGAELLTDTAELIKEISEDFWRKNFVNITEAEKKMYSDIKFETILDLTKTFIKHHNVELVNSPTEDLATLKRQYSEITNNIYQQLSKLNVDDLEQEMLDFFEEHASKLNKPLGKKYFERTISDLARKLKNGETTLNDLQIFSHTYIEENLFNAPAKKSGFILPDAEFFKIGIDIPELIRIQTIKSGALHKALYEYTQSELAHIKESRHILTFDDLINKLFDVLNEESEQTYRPLTELIRDKYKIAFVDEFQDTDKQQYAIFKNIFGGSDKHGFFMIGDPKQSIYKFRGADIFSYLKAKNDAQHKYTLLKNFRSERGMIDAVNAVFQFREKLIENIRQESPGDAAENEDFVNSDNADTKAGAGLTNDVFVCSPEEDQEGIEFHPAEFGKTEKKTVLRMNHNPQNLQLWLVDGFNPAFIEYNIAQNIALEITKLVSGDNENQNVLKSLDGERPLSLGDIAILVNTNEQAAKIKHELSKSNIPGVIQRTAKLFESQQAGEIKLWLKAIIKPTEKNIRPLFVTDILRKSVYEIDSITDDEILGITEEFTLLKQKCQIDGVFASFIHFINKFDVMEKALKKSNGERVVTNYFHIADLLHKHELKFGRNIEKTLSYLEQEMQSESSDDEKQEQLESDKKAVKIMTIHKSKGLQFPVVFCPYIWNNAITKGEGKQKILLFNERENGEFIQKLDLGADKEVLMEHQQKARVETLAEQVRLLYVALTRAENRCYLAVGNHETVGKSVLSYIFTNNPKEFVYGISGRNVGQRVKAHHASCMENLTNTFGSPGGEFEQIARIETKGAVNVQPRLENSEDERTLVLSPKELKVNLVKNWSVGSFSGLIANIPYTSDSAEDGAAAFALPRGKTFGTAVHKIFENYYLKGAGIFSDATLRRYHFQSPLEEEPFFRISDEKELNTRFQIAENMFKTVLSANIATGDATISLGEIPQKDVKTEFKFYHRVNKISPKLLKQIFSEFATGRIKDFSEKMETLGFSMRKGYMYGEIDLLFRKDDKYYVLDWKTNHLGADFANYSPGKIEANMCEHLYMLQAHVYSLATHLFLKQQLRNYDYDTHFGGFIYVYTRGVDNIGNGVYSNKPTRALIENMEKNLCV